MLKLKPNNYGGLSLDFPIFWAFYEGINHVRHILDGVDPALFTPVFDKIFDDFRLSESFNQFKVLDNQYLIAIDGTEFHNSKKIMCKNCYTRYHKKEDDTDFVHIAVGTVLCSPKTSEVVAFSPVFVERQECGNGKQDTECKAASRMLSGLHKNYQVKSVFYY
jgi:hypothetical protein